MISNSPVMPRGMCCVWICTNDTRCVLVRGAHQAMHVCAPSHLAWCRGALTCACASAVARVAARLLRARACMCACVRHACRGGTGVSRHGSACLRLAHVDLLEPSVDGVAREVTHQVAVPAQGAPAHENARTHIRGHRSTSGPCAVCTQVCLTVAVLKVMCCAWWQLAAACP